MKKQLFSLVMMLALVIVAGSAMGQTKSTPYPGGTYNYTVSDIKAFSGGTVTITYSGSNSWTDKGCYNRGHGSLCELYRNGY
jgi:uncharacterized alpha/beta hydrolase family protein